ncbi:hypothetical protein ODJ79_31670 [Actinoplanes sp. KI2]|uniref:hypothetical protein n=1 Tax=Actinoplanes sp. KI2 TaxID=2983315 RepID=UPI0021D5CE3D|nr:hypothetical protein [Actinoplanes sp. KI2]MCU7728299.1 hypothetical protein [Actinoplanes sp. KI2]
MTSPQASRRGSFVAPALLFVALLGGALFFGLLAVSGQGEPGVATDNAAVTDPSPSKAAPAARTIVTTLPSATGAPPEGGRIGSPAEDRARPESESESEEARQVSLLPRKPVPGHTTAAVVGDYCAPAGTKARGSAGDRLVCKPGEDDGKSRWEDDN